MADQPWVVAGKKMIGQKEIPGPRENSWIKSLWDKLPSWFPKTERTPWCGGFVNWCMKQAGVQGPKTFYRAKDWASWGVPCVPQPGAVAVKERKGGGHVMMLLGVSEDLRYYIVLEGNANDSVKIGAHPAYQIYSTRWPSGHPQPKRKLPILPMPGMTTKED